jgi:hypothetical protein
MNSSLRSREGRNAMGCTTTSQRTLLTLGAVFKCTPDSAVIQNGMNQFDSDYSFRDLIISCFVPSLFAPSEPSGSKSTSNATKLHQGLKEQQRNRVVHLLVSFVNLVQAPH